MGVYSGSNMVYMGDTYNAIIPASEIKVGKHVMTDMSTSRVYFKSKSGPQLLKRFTIKCPDSFESTFLVVTNNHVMLKGVAAEEVDSGTSSSDNTRIPEMIKCEHVPASQLTIGDHIPRWNGSSGIVVNVEYIVGKTTQLMTENGLLMIDRNIITCYVAPYPLIKNISKPVKYLSHISTALVSKPFYYVPEKLYKFGIDHA